MSSHSKNHSGTLEHLPLKTNLTKEEIEKRATTTKQIQKLKEEIRDNADHAIHHQIPAKIFTVLQLYNKFSSSPYVAFKAPDLLEETDLGISLKKRKVENFSTRIPLNNSVTELLTDLKKELIELVEMMNTVKLWIQLNIPKIEDGNNFGVSIQEEAIRELQRVEESGSLGIEAITKYFLTRAKLASKVLKYPHIEDYVKCIHELDEKEHLLARLCALELRENYFLVHDIIMKNLEKIKTPRGPSHSESRYI